MKSSCGLLLLLLALPAAHAERAWRGACPEGCQCTAQTRGAHGCALEVRCEEPAASFPTGYAPETDCVSIANPKLGRLSVADKAAMFAAMPAGLKLLDLSMCGLGGGAGLPAATFGRFAKLRFLNLEFNRLTELPSDAFHGLTSLRTLWLTGNHYQRGEPGFAEKQAAGNNLGGQLDPAQFRGLGSLQALLMHHNKMTALPDGLFEDTRMLRVLKLVDNAFSPALSARDAVFAPLLARDDPRLPPCQGGAPSTGGCLQLDIDSDSGDSLEDIWDALGIGLADDATVLAAPQDMPEGMGDDGGGDDDGGSDGGDDEEDDDERRDDEDHDEL